MQKIWLLIAVCFGLIAQPSLADQAQNSPAEIGRIKNVTPNGVNIISRVAGDRAARSGFRLYEGDIIETAANGRVGITFIDDTRIAVAPGSRMIISSYRFNRARLEGSSQMDVVRGKVGVDSGQLSSTGNMRFRAGQSTLGVRGTHFVIEVDD